MELPILTPYKTGFSKVKLTFFKEDFGLLGYGLSKQKTKGIHDDLFVRTFFINSPDNEQIVICVCDLGFITDLLKSKVLEIVHNSESRFTLTQDNLLLLAQHTHSAPGGYGHYLFYNMSIPGLVPEILEHFAQKIAESIYLAYQNQKETNLSLTQTCVSLNSNIAFNRSLQAYNQNSDVDKLPPGSEAYAVNREMFQLNFTGPNETKLGLINWFGTHTTSVSNDNHLISADNKGYAADKIESLYSNSFIAAFAQGSCGDISPKFNSNHNHSRQRGYFDGMYPDDFESAKYNGHQQAEYATTLYQKDDKTKVSGNIRSLTLWYNFSSLKCSPKYTLHHQEALTNGPCMGVAFITGSFRDGPGIPPALSNLLNQYVQITKWLSNDTNILTDSKNIVVDARNKKLLHFSITNPKLLPTFIDETVKHLSYFVQNKASERAEWLPALLPIQLVQIGQLLLIGIPFEITTVAQRRLLKGIQNLNRKHNFSEVIICPYANSYAGYITTPEEYEIQMYEGGHSLFGKHSLAGLQTAIEDIMSVFFDKKMSSIAIDKLPIPKEILPLLSYKK